MSLTILSGPDSVAQRAGCGPQAVACPGQRRISDLAKAAPSFSFVSVKRRKAAHCYKFVLRPAAAFSLLSFSKAVRGRLIISSRRQNEIHDSTVAKN